MPAVDRHTPGLLGINSSQLSYGNPYSGYINLYNPLLFGFMTLLDSWIIRKQWDFRDFWPLSIPPWKFNIAPENIPSQKESSIPTIIFQGLCSTSGGYILESCFSGPSHFRANTHRTPLELDPYPLSTDVPTPGLEGSHVGVPTLR